MLLLRKGWGYVHLSRREDSRPHLGSESVAHSQGIDEVHLCSPSAAHSFHYLGTKCVEAWVSAGCSWGGSTTGQWPGLLHPEGLTAWRGAHLGKGTCQPHSWQDGDCLPVFLSGQVREEPCSRLWVKFDAAGRGLGTQGVVWHSPRGESTHLLDLKGCPLLPPLRSGSESPGNWAIQEASVASHFF